MRVTIYFDCDSTAFKGSWGSEAARILRGAARRIEDAESFDVGFPLRDSNGNRVGRFEIAEGELS